MAKRRIGDAVVTITYVDRGDQYVGSIKVPDHRAFKFSGLRAPPIGLPFAYDSSKAYDKMAQVAVSFGAHDHREIDDATGWAMNDRGGYSITRKRRRSR